MPDRTYQGVLMDALSDFLARHQRMVRDGALARARTGKPGPVLLKGLIFELPEPDGTVVRYPAAIEHYPKKRPPTTHIYYGGKGADPPLQTYRATWHGHIVVNPAGAVGRPWRVVVWLTPGDRKFREKLLST